MSDIIDDEFIAAIEGAFDSLANGVEPPDIHAVLDRQRRTHRRRVTVSSVLVVALGIGGLATINSRSGSDAVDINLTDVAETDVAGPTQTTAPEWFCTDRIGTSTDGRALFGDCQPNPDAETTDWSCDGRLGIDDVGRTRFSDCTPVGQLGPVPSEYASVDTIDPDAPPPPPMYRVAAGDFPVGVAAMFCTDVAQLAAVNEWSSDVREFPSPGELIRLPQFDLSCANRRHTVVAGDYPIAIAAQYCVSLESLWLYNESNEALISLAPGTVLLIAPSTERPC